MVDSAYNGTYIFNIITKNVKSILCSFISMLKSLELRLVDLFLGRPV